MATYGSGGGWTLVKTQYTLTESYVTFYTCPADTYAVIGSIHLWANSSAHYANIKKFGLQLDGSGYYESFGASANTSSSTIDTYFTNWGTTNNVVASNQNKPIANPWSGSFDKVGDSLYSGEYLQAEKSTSTTGYITLYTWEFAL